MVEGAISGFVSYLSLQKRFSPLTTSSYSTDLRQFFSFVAEDAGEYSPTDITFQHIRGFIAQMMDNGLSPVTVNRKLSAVKSFFKYLHRNGLVKSNPALKLQGPRKPKRLPVFLDETATARIFSGMEFSCGFDGKRDRLIIDLLYQTGMRRAEILGLKESDADLYNLHVKVLGKRNKERIIPISHELRNSLKDYLAEKKRLGLVNPQLLVTSANRALTAGQLTKIVKSVLMSVSSIKKNSPHVMRHTFATHLLNNGADINAVKELLGHASLAATQVYTHNSIEKLQKTYKQAHPRSGH